MEKERTTFKFVGRVGGEMAALFPAERRDFCPLIGHLGGNEASRRPTMKWTSVDMCVGAYLKARTTTFGLKDRQFFFHAKKNAGICGFLWGWVIDASC